MARESIPKAVSNSPRRAGADKTVFPTAVGNIAQRQSRLLSKSAKSLLKNVSIQDAIKNGASVHRVQYLIKNGADPHVVDSSLNENALHAAAKTGSAEMCALLLYRGDDLTKKNVSGYTPLELAPKKSSAEVLLASVKSKLQNNNLRTQGMLPEMLFFVKQNMISSIRPLVDEDINQSLDLGVAVENALLSKNDDKAQYVKFVIKDLKANQFLWFSNGFDGHAINFILKKNEGNHLEFVIANRGSFSDIFHSKDESGHIFPIVYLMGENESSVNREAFIDRIVSSLIKVYEHYRSNNFMDGYEFYNEFDLSQMHGVEELMQYGPPSLPQQSDNCITMSHWAAVDYLFPEESADTCLEEIRMAYENLLDKEIAQAVPRLTGPHLSHIVDIAKAYNDDILSKGDDNINPKNPFRLSLDTSKVNEEYSNKRSDKDNNIPRPSI